MNDEVHFNFSGLPACGVADLPGTPIPAMTTRAAELTCARCQTSPITRYCLEMQGLG